MGCGWYISLWKLFYILSDGPCLSKVITWSWYDDHEPPFPCCVFLCGPINCWNMSQVLHFKEIDLQTQCQRYDIMYHRFKLGIISNSPTELGSYHFLRGWGDRLFVRPLQSDPFGVNQMKIKGARATSVFSHQSSFVACSRIVDRPASPKFRFNQPANNTDNFLKTSVRKVVAMQHRWLIKFQHNSDGTYSNMC